MQSAAGHLLCRYFMEVPDENDKVEVLEEGKPITLAISREELDLKIQKEVPRYEIFNGMAMTSLLKRVLTIYEDHIETLSEDLLYLDEDDKETLSFA